MADKKHVRLASLGAMAAQMAQLFSPPGSVQQPFNAYVYGSARTNLLNEQNKYAQKKAEESKGGFGGAVGGAVKGGLQGFAAGGPIGAAAGAGLGGYAGYSGPKQSFGSMLGDTALAMTSAFPGKSAAAPATDAINMNPAVPNAVQSAMGPAPGYGVLKAPPLGPVNPQTMTRTLATAAPAWRNQTPVQNILAGLRAQGGQEKPLPDGQFLVYMPY
jgi:hypothetical protein